MNHNKGKYCTRSLRLSLSLLLVFVLAMVMGSSTAYASIVYINQNNFRYNVYTDESGSVVESIGLAKYTGTARSVYVPGNVTYKSKTYPVKDSEGFPSEGELSIEAGAFANNTNIEEIAIADGFSAILDIFSSCTSLKKVAIPDTIQYFTQDAFADCPAIKDYYINGDSIGLSDSLPGSGIGVSSAGVIYPGVRVHTKNTEGNPVIDYVNDLNKLNEGGNQIKLVFENNPFEESGIKDDTSSGSGNSGSGNSGSGDSGSGNSGSGNSGSGDSGSGNSGSGNSGSGNSGSGSSTPQKDRTKIMGKDGTPFGKGAAQEAANKKLVNTKNEKDPKGSVFSLLRLKTTKVTKTSIKLSWKKVRSAKKYIVYGARCTTKKRKDKYSVLTRTSRTKYTFKKYLNKPLENNTYYKFIVVATDTKNNVVTTSKIVHAATVGTKFGNDKAVTTKAKDDKVTLILAQKATKTFKLGAKSIPASKKLKVGKHRNIKYESDNPTVATVNGRGTITAKKKGKCHIFVYAQNGISKKITVTVKAK